ncbi:MAG: hypothetical protein KGL35_11860 [Bradyrhizobium sp.]|nr:hypothetical protein [Bradyrhizobium sp.]
MNKPAPLTDRLNDWAAWIEGKGVDGSTISVVRDHLILLAVDLREAARATAARTPRENKQ